MCYPSYIYFRENESRAEPVRLAHEDISEFPARMPSGDMIIYPPVDAEKNETLSPSCNRAPRRSRGGRGSPLISTEIPGGGDARRRYSGQGTIPAERASFNSPAREHSSGTDTCPMMFMYSPAMKPTIFSSTAASAGFLFFPKIMPE